MIRRLPVSLEPPIKEKTDPIREDPVFVLFIVITEYSFTGEKKEILCRLSKSPGEFTLMNTRSLY